MNKLTLQRTTVTVALCFSEKTSGLRRCRYPPDFHKSLKSQIVTSNMERCGRQDMSPVLQDCFYGTQITTVSNG